MGGEQCILLALCTARSCSNQVSALPAQAACCLSTHLSAHTHGEAVIPVLTRRGPSMLCRQAPEKSDKEITTEIQAIIRQITASVTFLPLLNDACKLHLTFFDIIC